MWQSDIQLLVWASQKKALIINSEPLSHQSVSWSILSSHSCVGIISPWKFCLEGLICLHSLGKDWDIWMGMHYLQILNNQKVLDWAARKENIPLVLINSWLWHEFHKHRLSYRMCSYCNAEEGNVFVWGYGILGKGPNLIETAVPEMIPPSLFGWTDSSPDIRVAHVCCGLSQFAALTSKFLILLSWRGHVAVSLTEEKKKQTQKTKKQNQDKTKTKKLYSSKSAPVFLETEGTLECSSREPQHIYRGQHGSCMCFVLTYA